MVEDKVITLGPSDRHLTFEVGNALDAEVDVVDLELVHRREKTIIAALRGAQCGAA
jgi:hypothetical protein